MEYTHVALLQTSLCSLMMDTLRGLEAAACFVQQTFLQTRCLLARRALSQKKKKQQKYVFILQRILENTSLLV